VAENHSSAAEYNKVFIMHPSWQEFLAIRQAQIDNGTVMNFGDAAGELAAARDATVLCDLSHFGVLKVSGEDAQSFLQNLFSSDVKAVTPAQAQWSSFNTAKGRILATFLVWQTGPDYFLQLPKSLAAALQKKLSMYVLRSKVKITDVSDELVCLGLAGKEANALALESLAAVPADILGATQSAGASVIRLGQDRLVAFVAPQAASMLWESLACGSRPAGAAVWDWLNIRAGIPVVLPATQEEFVPQMANLELIGAVNFKKGCYPGQEIVARMQYLGRLKQRMYLAHLPPAHIPGNSALQPGDKLYSAEMEGQSSGTVVNAAPAPGGGYDLLAVVQISSRASHSVHLGSPQGAALEFLPLPYPLP
jgi:folate-binding protein YgfZ